MTLGENYYYGGLLRFDMSPKPAYFKIKELLGKTWHTEEELCCDTNGTASFRGFFGTYEAEITLDGVTVTKEFTLDKNADSSIEITL